MKQPLKYVNFYKRALQKSCLYNLVPDESLALVMENPLRPAGCITRMFDTRDADMTYNRLKLEGVFEGAKLEVLVAASNSDTAVIEKDEVSLEEYFADPAVPMEEKRECLCALPHVRAVNACDLLLHSLTGQFVWIYVGITPSGPGQRRLDGMRLEFPKESFTAYFPEIYQESDFFDRYVSIFQSMLTDLEQRVDEVPQKLDYETTDEDCLRELASWLGIENKGGLLSPEQLRRMIRDLDLYQGRKGTHEALEAIIELVCGIRPRIVEHFLWSGLPSSASRRRLNEQLYSANANQFCVIMDLTKTGGRLPIPQEELERIIDEYSVIGTTHRLVLLRRCSHTDAHCYLDVNSCLTTPETANVDGMTLGGYITVG